MAGDAVLREVTKTLPMAPDMEIEASEAVTQVARAIAMSPDKIDEIRMAVVEACLNAFEHSRAADRHVYLRVAVLGYAGGEPEKLCVTVRDTGVGFDESEVQEPSIEKKLKAERKRGWGLTIIRGLMDEVRVRSGRGGTTIVMCKLR